MYTKLDSIMKEVAHELSVLAEQNPLSVTADVVLNIVDEKLGVDNTDYLVRNYKAKVTKDIKTGLPIWNIATWMSALSNELVSKCDRDFEFYLLSQTRKVLRGYTRESQNSFEDLMGFIKMPIRALESSVISTWAAYNGDYEANMAKIAVNRYRTKLHKSVVKAIQKVIRNDWALEGSSNGGQE